MTRTQEEISALLAAVTEADKALITALDALEQWERTQDYDDLLLAEQGHEDLAAANRRLRHLTLVIVV